MAARDNRGPQPKALAIVAGIAALGLAVSIVVGRGGSSAAEKNALSIVNNVLPSLMDPADLAAPVIGTRYTQLSNDLQKTVTDPNILRVSVWQKSGVVVFSTNPDLVGLAVTGAKPQIDAAFAGKVQSSVGIGDGMPTDGSQQGETFRTFAPIRLQPGDPITGVAEIVQPVPTGGGSKLWSASKVVFNVVLIVSLVWLWFAMGSKSGKAARIKRYDLKQREKAVADARRIRQHEPTRVPASSPPAVEGPLFADTPAAVVRPREQERPRFQGIPAADTWAFGPEVPEPAKRKGPKTAAAKPKIAEPEIVQPVPVEAPTIEPEVAQPAATIEPEVAAAAQPAAATEVLQPVAAVGRPAADDAEERDEEFDPGAWIVPRFEQEARRREAERAGVLSGVVPAAAPEAAAEEAAAAGPEGAGEAEQVEKEREGIQVAQEAQAARDARDAERDAAEAAERDAAAVKQQEAAEAAEAALAMRAAEREAAQAVHAAELEGMQQPAEGAEPSAAEPSAAEPSAAEAEAAAAPASDARDAALREAALAREESDRAAEKARASQEKARAAQEAARAAREEIAELEAEMAKLEEARRIEDEAHDRVRAAQDAARAAREEMFQLEEEARRLREEIRRA